LPLHLMKSKRADKKRDATLVARAKINVKGPQGKSVSTSEQDPAIRRGSLMNAAQVKPDERPVPGALDAQSLREAFLYFVEATKELEDSQNRLADEIHRLSGDLARSNANLKVQMEAKSRLADELSGLISALPTGVVLMLRGEVYAFNAISRIYAPELQVGSHWSTPSHWIPSESGHFRCNDGIGDSRILRPERHDLNPHNADKQLLLIHDVTATYQSQEDRARQAKLTSMGRMTAEIAHQLRTPLATAMIYAAHLSSHSLSDLQRTSFSKLLNSQLLALESLVSRMLGFLINRRPSPELVTVENLLEECRESIQPLFDAKGVRLKIQCSGGKHLIGIQRDHFRGGLVSILENALEVSTEGQEVIIQSIAKGSRLDIKVLDEGPGLPGTVIERLFEPFSTSRPGGTGLGLAIAKAAFENHGGQVSLSNLEPRGACFHIVLPVFEPF